MVRKEDKLQQTDLFGSMSKGLLKQVMGITLKESHGEEGVLFRGGYHAIYTYRLFKGYVSMEPCIDRRSGKKRG